MPKKIKNPERYIARLRRRIADMDSLIRTQRRTRDEFRGECIVTWADHVNTEEAIAGSYAFLEFRPEDKIITTGIVKEVSAAGRDSYITYKRIQTKKVRAI